MIDPLVLTAAPERKGLWFPIDVDASIFLWLVAFVGKLVLELLPGAPYGEISRVNSDVLTVRWAEMMIRPQARASERALW